MVRDDLTTTSQMGCGTASKDDDGYVYIYSQPTIDVLSHSIMWDAETEDGEGEGISFFWGGDATAFSGILRNETSRNLGVTENRL